MQIMHVLFILVVDCQCGISSAQCVATICMTLFDKSLNTEDNVKKKKVEMNEISIFIDMFIADNMDLSAFLFGLPHSLNLFC